MERALLKAVHRLTPPPVCAQVAYMGVLMMSLEASHAQAAAAGGVLSLLERALGAVPSALLSAKGPKMASVIVSVANMHADQPTVVRPALSCARRLLMNIAPRSADAGKLWRWLLEFTTHSQPKVRQRGQATATEVLREAGAAAEGAPASAAATRFAHLSSLAAKHIEARLTTPSLKDVQPILFLLHFLHAAIRLLAPTDAASVAAALLKLPALSHPLISQSSIELLQLVAASDGVEGGSGAAGSALPAQALATTVDGLLAIASGAAAAGGSAKAVAAAAALQSPALRSILTAESSLCAADISLGGKRLAPVASALLEALLASHIRGGDKPPAKHAGRTSNKGGAAADEGEAAPAASLSSVIEPHHLSTLVTTCTGTTTDAAATSALAAALGAGLEPRYLPLWRPVLEAIGDLFSALGQKASPAADGLLAKMYELYSDHARLREARGTLMASLGLAARAIGPERFVRLLPIKVSTTLDGEDSSWLLSVLRGHIGGDATLSFFATYFMPLQTWLLTRAAELGEQGRSVEQKNLHNLYEQVCIPLAEDVRVSYGAAVRGRWHGRCPGPPKRELG